MPPLAEMVILASLPGTQEGMVFEMDVMSNAAGCVMMTAVDILHTLASVALMVYVFAFNPLNDPFVLVIPDGKIVYVMIPVPPEAIVFMLPSELPKQFTLILLVDDHTSCVG